MKRIVRRPAHGEALQHQEARSRCDDAREPARFGDVDRADQQEPEEQQRAGHDEHHERDQLVLEVARLLLDAPRVVDGRRDCAKHAHRRPDHEHAAEHAQTELCPLQLPRAAA